MDRRSASQSLLSLPRSRLATATLRQSRQSPTLGSSRQPRSHPNRIHNELDFRTTHIPASRSREAALPGLRSQSSRMGVASGLETNACRSAISRSSSRARAREKLCLVRRSRPWPASKVRQSVSVCSRQPRPVTDRLREARAMTACSRSIDRPVGLGSIWREQIFDLLELLAPSL